MGKSTINRWFSQLETSIYNGFPIVMLNNRMVYTYQKNIPPGYKFEDWPLTMIIRDNPHQIEDRITLERIIHPFRRQHFWMVHKS